jgi:predicted dehydrogenase
MATRPVEAVVLGAGGRGRQTVGGYARQHPYNLKIVAVAEPDPERRKCFAEEHNIPPARRYPSWEDLLAQPQLAPALFNTTMDQMHFASTMPALAKGYHVLVEKPLTTDPVECVQVVEAAKAHKRILQCGYTLRYAPFFRTVKELVANGTIGDLITVQHVEHVAYWHMAHSFVRGNWGNAKRCGSPMILSKCCHDLDILRWIIGRKPVRVASFGSLTHFTAARKPAGAPARCTDGCPVEHKCPYSALKLYLTLQPTWIADTISLDTSYDARRKALETGPYGKCVYQTDNDVVDHQVIILEFEGGLTVMFTMEGHSHDNVRTMRYSGTAATIRGHAGLNQISVHHYNSGTTEQITPGGTEGGHGGGDPAMIREFTEAVRREDPSGITASGEESVDSHLLAFAAEMARRENTVVDFAAYKADIEKQARAKA